MKKLSLLLIVFAIVLAGCATATLKSEKTLNDGTKIKYVAKINTFFQDFSGSDLAATLDPDGKNTIKAGAVDATTSPVGAEMAKAMVELVKIMLPYIATVPTVP